MNLLEKLVKQMVQLKKCLAKRGRSFTALASAVVLFMTYAMTLPVFTMDTKPVQAETNIESASEAIGGGNEQKADAAEEAKPSAEKAATYLSKTLVLKKDGYTVTVVPNEKAQIPEGTTLSVEKIDEKSDEYKKVKELVASARNAKENELGMDALNISLFDGNGQEVEPKAEVAVKVEADNLPKEAEDITIHHIKDNPAVANADMIDGVKTLLDKSNTEEVGKAKAADGKADVEFKTGSFSPFTVSWAKVVDAAGDEGNNEANEAEKPYSLNEHPNQITKVDIYYETTENGTKKLVPITDSTVIPDTGVNGYEINVEFSDLPTKALKDTYGKQVSFQLPSQLTNPTVAHNDVEDENHNNVGTIIAENGIITITYNEDHLKGDENARTSGTFTFQCEIDRSNNTDNPMQIKIGNITKTLQFQTHEIAETGVLNIEKSDPKYIPGEKTDGSMSAEFGYLEYTLNVSTGADAMPDVYVKDAITNGDSYVDGYLVAGTLADGTATSLTGDVFSNGYVVTVPGEENDKADTKVEITGTSPDSMTWTIGDMVANETRTLTYRIKLNRNYVGLYNTNAIKNTATPYSKTFAHKTASASFTAQEHATVDKKKSGDVVDNPKANNGIGTVTIPYTVTITADKNNTWPIRRLKINDHLQKSYNTLKDPERTKVREALCEYAKFDNFSIKVDGVDRAFDTADLVTYYNKTGRNSGYNPSFDIYVGDVAPGKTLTLAYNIVVDKRIFTTMNRTWGINNSVSVHTDDSKDEPRNGWNADVGSGTSNTTIGTQIWERKVMGDQLSAELKQEPDGMEEKTIPEKAIKYQVIANEAGKWDLSQAKLTDRLGDHLQYVGYLQVDYYQEGISYNTSGESVTLPNDTKAISDLQAKQKTSSIYVDIDGIDNDDHNTFTFIPKDHGLTATKGAYLLTYYAIPVDTEKMSTFQATNNFSISGRVAGPGGGGYFTIPAVTNVSISKTVSGGANFSVTKQPWYYDSYANDAYWVIEVSGDYVPAELAFQDVPTGNCTSPQLVGAYIGTIGGTDHHLADAYKNINAFEKNGKSSLTELKSGEDYTWTTGSNTGTFNVLKEQTLGGDNKLYVIVKTQRSLSGTINKRGFYTLDNKLNMKEAGESSFREVNTAHLTTLGGGDIFKELGQVANQNGAGEWSSISGVAFQGGNKIITDKVTEAGTYIDWRIKVNMLPNLSGTYEVTDTLPAGVEPVYVRYFWIDTSIRNSNDAPTMPVITELDEDKSWRDVGLVGVPMDGTPDKGTAHAYYNESTKKIRFDVGNLKGALNQSDSSYPTNNNRGIYDKRSLEVQVLVKVTDEAALAGESKEYLNAVSMQDESGVNIGKDTSGVTFKKTTISKSNNNLSNGRVPFTLDVNPLGEDLVPGASTITIVDELSDPLVYDLSSIKVANSAGKDITNSVDIQDGGRTGDDKGSILKFIVPDDQHLTITYGAIPYVQANGTFELKNKAYYSGYSKDAASVDVKNFQNTVTATSITTTKPQIIVTKRDIGKVTSALGGATFTLTQVTWNSEDNTWKPVEGFVPLIETTSSDPGKNFGKATFNSLEYDTVYKLEETVAPDGYEKDSTPKYIVIAKNTGTVQAPHYSDNIATYVIHGATVQYTGWQCSVDVFDSPKDVYDLGLTLKKVDESNNEKALEGAEFKLYKMEGQQRLYFKSQDSASKEITWTNDADNAKIFITGEDGTINIGNLPRKHSGDSYVESTFYLEETKAPKGYIINSKILSFKVNAQGQIVKGDNENNIDNTSIVGVAAGEENSYTLTVSNAAGTALPSTGGSGTMLFYILGVALAIGAGAIFRLQVKNV